MHLADYRHLLLEFRHDEFVSVAKNDVGRRADRRAHYARQIDYEPTDRA